MPNKPTNSWDETKPAGTRDINLGDDDIREFKTQVREVVGADHKWESSGQGTDWGHHQIITLLVQSTIGTLADAGKLYTKDVSAKAELHWKDEDGNEIQLTSAGDLYLTGSNAVLLTGDQTIAGVKTFSSFPITPSEAPTTDYQVANKKYVDDQISAGGYSSVSVADGTVADGGTIPLPSGYTEGECAWIVSMGSMSATTTQARGLRSMDYTADGTRTVTAEISLLNWVDSQVTYNLTGTANYLIVGVS